MIPTPGSIIYYNNGTQVNAINQTVLTSLYLVPKSQTDYLFYTISPSLPPYLSLDPYTGIISGTTLKGIEKTKFVIQGVSIYSAVNTALTITITEMENTTVVGGMLDGVHARIKVTEKYMRIMKYE